MDEYKKLLAADGPTVDEYADYIGDEERIRVREIWERVIHFTRAHKGPFWYVKDLAGKKKRMLDLACELFPSGPPMQGKEWIKFGGEKALKLAELPRYLFARSVPTPLSSF